MAKRWSKEEWRERRRRRGEELRKKAEDAVARVLTVGAERGNMDVTAGWEVAGEGVAPLKRGDGENRHSLQAGRLARR